MNAERIRPQNDQQNVGQRRLQHPIRILGQRPLVLAAVMNCLFSVQVCLALPPLHRPLTPTKTTATIRDYRSQHVHLHTDLPAVAAEQLLAKLEQTIAVAASYWGRPSKKQIECYVVDRLENWPPESFPQDHAYLVTKKIGGGTEAQQRSPGRQQQSIARVFAASRPGIAEHELTHAYCLQAFGTSGPDWYKEGMAELMSFYQAGNRAVTCRPEMIQLLQSSRHRTVAETVSREEFTNSILHSVKRQSLVGRADSAENRRQQEQEWNSSDDEIVEIARESYCWSWAVCHFLYHHPDYQKRFRSLGRHYLDGAKTPIDGMFQSVMPELEFEFRQFIENLSAGYRVDLCRWNWHKSFTALSPSESRSCRICASRGYQPSGIIVKSGQTYHYTTEGRWSIGLDECSADGTQRDGGQLVATIMTAGELSEPTGWGSGGEFTPQTTGRLYFRCQDAWNDLANNGGWIKITVSPTRHLRP